MKKHTSLLVSLLVSFGILLAWCGDSFAERPTITSIRFPDGTIKIDGRSDDWARAGEQLQKCSTTAQGAELWAFEQPTRGVYEGPDDLSMTVWTATDGANFYVLGDVRDQYLTNTASDDEPFFGDDFEIFIDASPADERFVKKSENFRQLIFVPGYVNPRNPQVLIWQKDQVPGVEAASRIRPWGYTIEIKVPKALFPHWKANPELDAIGFDVMLNEADAPGVDIVHPAIKGALFLLSPASHFMSPAKLGLATLEPQPVQLAAPTAEAKLPTADEAVELIKQAGGENNQDAGAERAAQLVLDYIGTTPERLAAEALESSHELVRRAGAFVFAKRADIQAPLDGLRSMVEFALARYGRVNNREIRKYALEALARRTAVPAGKLFGSYARFEDPEIRLTFVWALGINGDASIAPELIKLLYDGNLRVRMMAALSLERLGDPSALPALREMAGNDPHHYARNQAERAVKVLSDK